MIKENKPGMNDFSKYRSELMGLAIISIIFFHYSEDALSHYSAGIHYTITYWYRMLIGSIGVEIFLFVSGMGLYFSMKRGGSSDILGFYKKRFVRVLIPYLVYASIAWFIMDVIQEGRGIGLFIYDLSTLGFWYDGRKTIWFVAFILTMYVVFPLIYEMVENKKSGTKTIIVIAIVIFILECFRVSNPEAYNDTEIALTRIPIFILGAYFGKKIYDKQAITPGYYALFISGIAAGFINFCFEYLHDSGKAEEGIVKILYSYLHHFDRYINAWYSLGIMFLAILILRKIIGKFKPLDSILNRSGALSFELYMTHVTVRRIFILAGLPIWLFKCYFVVIIISIVASVILNKVSDLIKVKMLHE